MHLGSRLNENQGTSKACNNVSRQAGCIARHLSPLNTACTVLFLENNPGTFDMDGQRCPGNSYADLAKYSINRYSVSYQNCSPESSYRR